MNDGIEVGLDLVLKSALALDNGARGSAIEDRLKTALRCAWTMLTPGQQAAVLCHPDVACLLDSHLPDGDDGKSKIERIDTAVYTALAVAESGPTLYDRLVSRFPGFIEDGDVNGADLVDWCAENIGRFMSTVQIAGVHSTIRKAHSSTDRGLMLRTQALGLLQEAQAIDGLQPFSVTHRHSFGSSTYLLWAEQVPGEQQAAAVLDADFEPEKGESLEVDANLSLEELCGVAVASRFDGNDA